MKFHKKDKIWRMYQVKSKQDHLNKFMPDLTLVEEVHEDVKADYETIGHLLACSYYHYKLFDEAVRKTIFTFEMALKIRYKEVTGNDWKKGNLQSLIKKISALDLFNVNKHFLERLRYVRNYLAHPSQHSFGGPSLYHWIENITLAINELYEIPEVRNRRKKKVKFFNSFFEKIDSGRPLIYQNEPDTFYQLQNIRCLFYDENSNEYLLAYFLTFDLGIYQGKDYHGDILPVLSIIQDLRKKDNEAAIVGEELISEREICIMETPSLLIGIHNAWLKKYSELDQFSMLEFSKHLALSKVFRGVKQRYLTQGKIMI